MNTIPENTTLIFDYDSTFSQVEGLDELVKICVQDEFERTKLYKEITRITNLAMDGKIDFRESVTKRLSLFSPTKDDVAKLIEFLKTKITPSIQEHQELLVHKKDQIFILSNGFKDFIVPVIEWFGLRKDHVFANTFVYNEQEQVIGCATDSPLSKSGGKPAVIKNLNLTGKIIMIGDGYNDYEVREKGAADQFILFTENITRDAVIPYADVIANNFNKLLNEIQ